MTPSPLHEICRRINSSGGSNNQDHAASLQNGGDLLHLQGILSKEDNVRTQARSATASAYLIERLIDMPVNPRRGTAALFAPRLGQLTMHMDQPLRSGPLMEIID